MKIARNGAAWWCLVFALALASCGGPKPKPPPPARPNGTILPLQTGHWAGIIGTWRIDFFIDRVTSERVAIRLVGGSIDPHAHNTPGNPVSFTDRPTTCPIEPNGTYFDCLRYKRMHVDNGFLCGTYILYARVYPICFQPMPGITAAALRAAPGRS